MTAINPGDNLGPVIPVQFWTGSVPVDGLTAFDLFEDDEVFADTAPQLATWIVSTLGFPVESVELTSGQLYQNFEFSIMKFTSVVNEFLMRDNMLSYQGMATGSSFSQTLIRSTPIPYLVTLAADYGTEAESGGDVDLKRGYVQLQSGVQDYDLQGLWAAVSESGNRLEIRKVYHERVPAMQRFYDPFGASGGGADMSSLLGSFGWTGFAVASNFLVMPEYETVLRAQAIEFNDEIRRSGFSFRIHNNKIRITPVPEETGDNMWFEYYVANQKFTPITTGSTDVARFQTGVVSDYSNAPFSFVPFSDINDVGKQWIYEYTLAMCKITLGNIRRKYSEMPIPNATVQLDGDILRTEGQSRIEQLENNLRETLEQTGKSAQLTKANENEQNTLEMLKRIPIPLYVF